MRLPRALLWGVVLLASSLHAEGNSVPIALQTELLSKVVKFDRHFAARAGAQAVVLIAHKPGNNESERIAQQYKSALEKQPELGGVPHLDALVTFTTASDLVTLARNRKASVIVLTPGVSSDALAIATAFAGYDGLTVSTTSEGVAEGIVLGFELIAGRPKMLVHLEQAKKQNADFRSEVLKLMKVLP